MNRREFLMSSAGVIGAVLLRPLLPVADVARVFVGYGHPDGFSQILFDKFLSASTVKPAYVFCHPDILADIDVWELYEASQDDIVDAAPQWFKRTNQSD